MWVEQTQRATYREGGHEEMASIVAIGRTMASHHSVISKATYFRMCDGWQHLCFSTGQIGVACHHLLPVPIRLPWEWCFFGHDEVHSMSDFVTLRRRRQWWTAPEHWVCKSRSHLSICEGPPLVGEQVVFWKWILYNWSAKKELCC